MSVPVIDGPSVGPNSLNITLPSGSTCMAVHAGGAVVSTIALEFDDNSKVEFVAFCLTTSRTEQLGIYMSLTPDQARTFAADLNAAADMAAAGLPAGQVQ